MNKKYYWLKLKENFFEEDTINWIEDQEKGVYYINFYLKLCLKAMNSEGKLIRRVGEMLIPYDIKALSKMTNVEQDTVVVAMEVLKNTGLIEILENGEIYLTQLNEMIGSETKWAEKKRIQREQGLLPPKSNAERQNAHRAKKYCEEKQHVPFIENHTNTKRYGGNYYIVFKRDQCKCRMCGSIERLCVHHIDGYDEEKPENNRANKMITLCRTCHGIAHSKVGIENDILESIGYYDESNESNESNVTSNVTCPHRDKRKDKDIDIEKEIYIEQPSPSASNSTKTTKEQKHKYGEFKHVLLTDKEKDKLLNELGEYKFNLVIKRLDEYIEETGKKYKNHNLTIRRWVIDAVTRQMPACEEYNEPVIQDEPLDPKLQEECERLQRELNEKWGY